MLGGEKHLAQNAAKAPDVNSLVVVLLDENDLWWSVPPSNHVARHASLLSLPLDLLLLLDLADLVFLAG